MTEIVIENTVETVIELEGGPVLTTIVSDENMAVVDVPQDPIVVDLNAGPIGEAGSQIFTGTAPVPEEGRLNDVYIVTSPNGSPTLGDMYHKSLAGWELVGNVRGPAGGINSVNGYTGPAVVLGKADFGLSNVDNTSDANKPISTAAQTALNGKVNNTGAETIAGVKTFSSAPVVPDSSWAISKTTNLQSTLDGKVSLTGAQTISDVKTFSKTPLNTPETGQMLHTQITSHNMRMWHDRFRFTSPVFTTSPDGTTWNAGSGGTNALDGRSDTSLAITHTDRYARWYWDNTHDISFGNIARLILRWGYTPTTPDALVTVESSANGTAWTVRGTTTLTSANTMQHSMALADNGGDGYYRVTIQIVGGGASGNVASLIMLEVQSHRIGSQGKGFEVELPYWWNATREVGLYNHLRPMTGAAYDIGLTGTRFKDAYFSGVVNAGTFAGSGASLTSLPAANLSGTIADARLSSNVALLAGTQTITGDKTFSGAVIVPTPTASGHAATKGYIDAIVDAAPGTLDTLNELAAALGDDPNFATTVTNSIATKAADNVVVKLTGDQTVAGIKTFSGTDTYIVRHRATTNATLNSRTDMTLGSVAGDIRVVRKHENVGSTNGFHLVDMLHRRAAGSDWQTTQWYQGNGVDTSYLDSPTTGASKLRTWIMRDPNNSTIAIGDSGNTFLTLTNTAITVGASAVFTGNGSGLTTLNGTNISSGTVADARLSSNVSLLNGAQTITAVKTFSVAPVVPDSSFAIAKTTGLQTALDSKQASLNNPTPINNIDWNTIVLNGSYSVNGSGGMGANGPSGTPVYGNLVVHHTGNIVTQIYYPHQPQAGTVAYVRSKYNASDWQAWRPLADATQAVFRVVHNGSSWPARPAGAVCVDWVGPTVPTAATANDTWWNTSV